MKSWSKLVFIFVMAACLSVGQTAPAGNLQVDPGIASQPVSTPQAQAPVTPDVAPAATAETSKSSCSPGPAWLCISQTLQPLMFSPDGSHRADADVAVDVPKAISKLTTDGVITPQNAPAGPIRSFDDAQKYLDTLAASASAITAPKSAPCPKDQPWLCDTPTSTPLAKSPGATGPSQPANSLPSSITSPTPSPGDQSTANAGSAGGAALPKLQEMPLYVLGINDVIQVLVFDEPHTTGTYTIGPDGRISMPMIGTFTVNGYDIPQLQTLLTQKLRDEGGILEPVVNVQLLRSNSKQYTLLGGFGHTGPVPLVRDTTILDAIAISGGFREFADKKHVVLRRGGKEFKFDYTKVVKGQNQDENKKLEDGDVLYVKGE
jgi:polysaccharide export outer membrane protein